MSELPKLNKKSYELIAKLIGYNILTLGARKKKRAKKWVKRKKTLYK